jgi:hypothetical protein
MVMGPLGKPFVPDSPAEGWMVAAAWDWRRLPTLAGRFAHEDAAVHGARSASDCITRMRSPRSVPH